MIQQHAIFPLQGERYDPVSPDVYETEAKLMALNGQLEWSLQFQKAARLVRWSRDMAVQRAKRATA